MLLAACQSGDQQKVAEYPEKKTEMITVQDWTKDKNLYEVNIRQYTKEGTFAAFEKEIPRLKEMGVDILWLMPIHEIGEKNRKGTLGSYYAIKDYKSINKEFGNKDAFRSLVKTIHENGMYILMDWVANHTGWDHIWTESNPEYFSKNEAGNFMPPKGTDWDDVIELDYSNPDVHDAMSDAMQYWVREFDIDGYRCDVADLVTMDFWQRVRPELDAIKPVFMLAEAENPKMHDHAFDMTYATEQFHTLVRVAQGLESPTALDSLLDVRKKQFPENAYRLNFITNHDENTWKGTIEELMGPAHKAMAVYTYTLPGMPLIYSGQESNVQQRIEFFEKDPIQWGNYSMLEFYAKLNALKHKNQALWNGEFGGDFIRLNRPQVPEVIAFTRNKDNNTVLSIFNFSKRQITFELNKDLGDMADYFNGETLDLKSGTVFELAPWDFKVYIK